MAGMVRSLGILALSGALMAGLCSCHNFAPSFGGGDPPQLSVTEPANLKAGQAASWSFAWTKGAGGPYKLHVELSPARLENGLLIIEGNTPPIEWTQDRISGRSLSHEFSLPNGTGAPLLYSVYVTIEDQVGNTGYGNPFFPSYSGFDSYSSLIEVAP